MEEPQKCSSGETTPQSDLLNALFCEDYDKFCELLENTQAVHSYERVKSQLSTCLETACQHPKIPTTFISKLLAIGVKPNANVVIPEPIHHAAKSGHAAALQILLSNSATKVNATDSSGCTALHYIVLGFQDESPPEIASGYQSCIEMLMQCPRYDINAIDNNGLSALHLAANKRREKVAFTIIEKARATHHSLDLDTHLAGGRMTREALKSELPVVSLTLTVKASNIPACRKNLLQAMEVGDFTLYQQLLRQAAVKDDFDIDFWFGQPYNTRLIERACYYHDLYLSAKFVKETLDAGAKPSSINLYTLRLPLHAATEAQNHSEMKLLLRDPPVNINMRDSNGQTPLHIAASCVFSGHLLDCLQLLLNEKDCDVNAKDGFGKTPLDVARCNDAIRLIQGVGGEKGVMDKSLISHFPTTQGENGDSDRVIDSVPVTGNISVDDKEHVIEMKTVNHIALHDVEKRLFQLMMQRSYEEFEKLFEITQFDGNFKYKEFDYTFLQFACEGSLHRFARKLLDKVDPNEKHDNNQMTPLMIACRQNDRCMVSMLLHTQGIREVEINTVDQKKNTALHYAAVNENLDIISELLNHGADMFVKNMFGKNALSADELEQLLDKSVEVSSLLPSNYKYAIILKFAILLSQRETNAKTVSINCSEPFDLEEDKQFLEAHFVASEMNFLNLLTDSDDYTSLLTHPLITSYVRLKYDHMKKYLYWKLALCITFVVTLNTYIVLDVSKSYDDLRFVPHLKIGCHVTAIVCTMCILLRETAQLLLKTKMYVRNSENIFVLSLILVATLSLVQCCSSLYSQWVYTAAILLSWHNLFLVTARTYKYQVTVQMLNAISMNYLNLLKSYIFIILGFSFSFYVIFSPSISHTVALNQTDNTGNVNKSMNYFENPLKTLLKTITMMTGEFDANDLPYPSDVWLSSLVFVLFLFFLHIVLLNLLTALTISDQQMITRNVTILSAISQVKLLVQIENTTLFLYQLFKPYKHRAKILQDTFLFAGMSLNETNFTIWPNKGKVTRTELLGQCDKHNVEHEMDFASEIIREVKCFAMGRKPLISENTSNGGRGQELT